MVPQTMTLCSQTMIANLYCKGVSAKLDKRQAVLERPGLPDWDVRKLVAQLLLEETIETIYALGLDVSMLKDGIFKVKYSDQPPEAYARQLEVVIDGCCDTIFTATGIMAACGVSDLPHLNEVNRANMAKFPGGQAILNESGKYTKPEGWKSPDHENLFLKLGPHANLKEVADRLVSTAERENRA